VRYSMLFMPVLVGFFGRRAFSHSIAPRFFLGMLPPTLIRLRTSFSQRSIPPSPPYFSRSRYISIGKYFFLACFCISKAGIRKPGSHSNSFLIMWNIYRFLLLIFRTLPRTDFPFFFFLLLPGPSSRFDWFHAHTR